MYINKILSLIGLTLLLAGCGGSKYIVPDVQYNQNAPSAPIDVQNSVQYTSTMYGDDTGGPNAKIAVLLPMSGNTKSVSDNIKTSLESALLRRPQANISLTFYDLSGDNDEKNATMKQALLTNPDVIIGPIFADDVKTLRKMKPSKTPVLSFTSDASALGDGVSTVNLIPTQSIETIIKQMQNDGATSVLILAPNDNSGHLMVSVADKATDIYDIPIKGIFYYDSANSESIKDVAMRASMYTTRTAANTRAREVLSDIMSKENLTSKERANLNKQLEKISRTETLGDLPYDAVLFLGNGEDTKTMASFLRYYGIGNRDAAFYGTTLWHNSDIASDFTMSGAKYATLPEISDNFKSLFEMIGGTEPDYLTAFGYDAANLALGLIFTTKPKDSYLYDPSGYTGTTGIFRIQPSGESERGLRVMELNASGTANVLKQSPENFLVPIYNVHGYGTRKISEKPLVTRGVNPGDYITIPERLRYKSEYRTKTLGANYTESEIDNSAEMAPIQVFAPTNETVANPEYESVKTDTISRKYIDSVEIEE